MWSGSLGCPISRCMPIPEGELSRGYWQTDEDEHPISAQICSAMRSFCNGVDCKVSWGSLFPRTLHWVFPYRTIGILKGSKVIPHELGHQLLLLVGFLQLVAHDHSFTLTLFYMRNIVTEIWNAHWDLKWQCHLIFRLEPVWFRECSMEIRDWRSCPYLHLIPSALHPENRNNLCPRS